MSFDSSFLPIYDPVGFQERISSKLPYHDLEEISGYNLVTF